MDSWKLTAILVCAGLAGIAFSPALSADEWDKKTIITFNAPVEVPGRVLAPGKYVFKLLDSQSDRNIVQIFNADENQLYATILAIPDYRLQPSDKPVITFEERAKGSPEAIKAWFYPGDNYGQQFVYPQPRAVELAKANNHPVLSMPAAMTSNIVKPAKSAAEPHVAAMKNAPVKAVEPTGEQVEIAQVVTPPQAARKRLPKGASELPLAGLIGLLSLGAAATLRLLSKRLA